MPKRDKLSFLNHLLSGLHCTFFIEQEGACCSETKARLCGDMAPSGTTSTWHEGRPT